MSFQIFSDGAADIPLDVAADNCVRIIPFYVSLDGHTYEKELYDMPLETYYRRFIQEKLYPRTSLPSVQDYLDAFLPVVEEGRDVLCFTITNTLSGSIQSAQVAKEMLEQSHPDRSVCLVNSFLATGAQYQLVMEAVRMRDAGFSVTETAQKMDKLKQTGRIFFMVGGLDHLQKGGRIGKVGAAAGNILKIKPLIVLQGGEISLLGVTRSRKSGLKKLCEAADAYLKKENGSPSTHQITMGTTNTPEELPEFQSLFAKQTGWEITSHFQIGATISSHTGPDTIGICLLKKYDA